MIAFLVAKRPLEILTDFGYAGEDIVQEVQERSFGAKTLANG
jgi:hypothetical protein